MAKLRFTGQADAVVTYQGKYEVTTGAILEDVPEGDVNTLLQSGAFEVFDDVHIPAKDEKKSEDTDKDKGKK